MSDERRADRDRSLPPGVDAIERRFRSPAVVVARPLILGSLSALGVVRRFRWRAEGVETLLDRGQPVIFAANHASHADTAAILGTLPRALHKRTCVAAALDVFGPATNGSKRSFAVLRRECLQVVVAAGFHAFAFDRQGPPLRSLRTAVTLVRRGWNILLYPEGTRSRTGRMGPFKAGVGILARTAGRPIIPVHVTGGPTILPCGRFLPNPGTAVVRYGECISPRRGESAEEVTERVRQRIVELGRVGASVAAVPEPAPATRAPRRAPAR
ncbi:MAG: 1-acyl-sn-glycerol-3-phosphate acyltransferase [Planctomycetes bacterium]|nr:1-acyl-sn-glycerol-3-phosphate acyltransferase [Planctomycetota bacterium]